MKHDITQLPRTSIYAFIKHNISTWFGSNKATTNPQRLSNYETCKYLYKLLITYSPSLFWSILLSMTALTALNASVFFIFIHLNQTHLLLHLSIKDYQYSNILMYLYKMIILWTILDFISKLSRWISKSLGIHWIAILEQHFFCRLTNIIAHIDDRHNIITSIQLTISHLLELIATLIMSVLQLSIQIGMTFLLQPHLIIPCLYLILARIVINYLITFIPYIITGRISELYAFLQNAIINKEVISAAHGEQQLATYGSQIIDSRKSSLLQEAWSNSLSKFLNELVDNLSYMYIFISQIPTYINHVISFDQLTFNIQVIVKLLPQLHKLLTSNEHLSKIKQYVNEIFKTETFIIETEEKITSTKLFISTPQNDKLVEIRNLDIYAGDKVFKISNFDISPGSILHITGENGSGKSTISQLLTGCILKDATKHSRYYKANQGGVMAMSKNLTVLNRPSKSTVPAYIKTNTDLLFYPYTKDEITATTDYPILFTYLNSMLSLNLEKFTKSEQIRYIKEQIKNDFSNIIGVKNCVGSSGQMQLMLGAGFYLQAHKTNSTKLIILDESFSNMDQSTIELIGKKERFIELFTQTISKQDAMIIIDHDTPENSKWTSCHVTTFINQDQPTSQQNHTPKCSQ